MFKFLFFILTCFTFASIESHKSHKSYDEKIIESNSNSIKFTNLAYLKIKSGEEFFICAGSLIDPQWILTSAQCMKR